MHYDYKAGVKRSKGSLWARLVIILILLTGVYLLILALSPAVPVGFLAGQTSVVEKLKSNRPTEDRLYIESLGVDLPIVTGDSDDALDRGVWHRKPENGNPGDGGNFVLSAHRFSLGWTPWQTRTKSPFYYIDQLNAGDSIFVDYGQKRYKYEVVKKYSVGKNDIGIEDRTAESKMTLYTCDLAGSDAGREVIEAKLVSQN